jgi:heat-inducible transcriptional repressor
MPSERQLRILKEIVDMYVSTAEPVGSKALAERMNGRFSSATLRNEMAELLSEGYLKQPHTSAGRVPTHKGYRLYVDELMNTYSLTDSEISELKQELNLRIDQYDRMMAEAGRLIARLTRYTSITLTPKLANAAAIRHIDIVIIDTLTFVTVMITAAGAVKSRVFRLSRPVKSETVASLVYALNNALSGIEPGAVTLFHIKALEAIAGEEGAELLAAALDLIKEAAVEAPELDVQRHGAGNLLNFPEFRDVDKARELLDFLNSSHPEEWVPLPDDDTPVVITIGSENDAPQLKGSSLIVAACPLRGGIKGYVGIVGPTRMDYSRLSARLSFFARALGAVIEDPDNIKEKDNG